MYYMTLEQLAQASRELKAVTGERHMVEVNDFKEWRAKWKKILHGQFKAPRAHFLLARLVAMTFMERCFVGMRTLRLYGGKFNVFAPCNKAFVVYDDAGVELVRYYDDEGNGIVKTREDTIEGLPTALTSIEHIIEDVLAEKGDLAKCAYDRDYYLALMRVNHMLGTHAKRERVYNWL